MKAMTYLSAFGLVAMLAGASTASAEDCELTIKRTACPGKEDAAYKPYKGVNPTKEPAAAADAGACKKAAEEACEIKRAGTLSEKEVSASFKGAGVDGGKNLCGAVAKAKSKCG
jgi:hypothetical protein